MITYFESVEQKKGSAELGLQVLILTFCIVASVRCFAFNVGLAEKECARFLV